MLTSHKKLVFVGIQLSRLTLEVQIARCFSFLGKHFIINPFSGLLWQPTAAQPGILLQIFNTNLVVV